MDLNTKGGALLPHGGHPTDVAPSAWIVPRAFVADDARLGEDTGVRYGPGVPATVGEGRVGGHDALVHGRGVGDGPLIGTGATSLDGAKIGGSIAAVFPEDLGFPARALIVGIPAKRANDVAGARTEGAERGTRGYVERAAGTRDSLGAGGWRDRGGR